MFTVTNIKMDKEDDNHLTRENAIKSLCELLGVISTQNVFCTESPNGISLGMDVGEWSGYFIVMEAGACKNNARAIARCSRKRVQRT